MTIIDFRENIKSFLSSYLIKTQLYFIDIFEFLALKDVVYPAVIIDFTGISASINECVSEYNFDFYIIDLINTHDKNKNEYEVITQCEMIAYNILAYLKSVDLTIGYDDKVTFQPIKDRFNDDEIAGVKFTLTLRMENAIKHCALPLSSAPDVILTTDGYPILIP